MVFIMILMLLFSGEVTSQAVENEQIKAKILGYKEVSVIELIADPIAHQSEVVRVSGYFCCGPEEGCLYLTKEHSDYCLWTNSVVVRFSEVIRLDGKQVNAHQLWNQINGQYIDVIGVYDMNYTGHAGECAGAILDVSTVSRLIRWREGKKWLNKNK